MGEDLGDGPVLDRVPAPQHQQVVGDVRDHAHVVGDEQHGEGALAAEPPQQVEDAGLHGDVERGRGLVGEECDRVTGQGHRDHRALELAAGQFVRVGLPDALRVGEPGVTEQFVDARPDPGAVEPGRVGSDGLGDLRADRQDGRERVHRLLEHHADARTPDGADRLDGGTDEFLATGPGAARHRGLRRQEPEHAHGADGLARAGLPHQGEDPAGRQVEGDVTDDGLRVAERDAEPLDLQDRFGHCLSETLR